MSQRMRWMFVIGWCIVIYCFSEFSIFTGESTERVLRHLLTYWPFASHGDSSASPLNFLVRKSAHVTAFGILAVLVFRALVPRRWAYVGAWAFAAVYAATDEWHQSFEPRRTAAVTDVAIDASGALLALAAVWMWRWVRHVRRKEFSA